MTEPVVIFQTQSPVEAAVVRGLLEAHGLPSMLSTPLPASVFPMSVNELGQVTLSVHPSDADEARRIIESHRTDVSGGVVRLRDEFESLQRDIDYRFRDRGLLEHAMTHTSRANEDVSGGVVDNESLEFLGDAVLGLIMAEMLYREFPEFDEGQKSKVKAALVSTGTLARQAGRLRLGTHLLLGRGEEKTGGRQKPALLADAYEALLAAIYLDGGLEHAQAFVRREFDSLLAGVRRTGVAGHDHKSALQEHLQSSDEPLPEYQLTGTTGPDHRKTFSVEVSVRGRPLAEGSGATKKEAEQEAARLALERLNQSR